MVEVWVMVEVSRHAGWTALKDGRKVRNKMRSVNGLVHDGWRQKNSVGIHLWSASIRCQPLAILDAQSADIHHELRMAWDPLRCRRAPPSGVFDPLLHRERGPLSC